MYEIVHHLLAPLRKAHEIVHHLLAPLRKAHEIVHHEIVHHLLAPLRKAHESVHHLLAPLRKAHEIVHHLLAPLRKAYFGRFTSFYEKKLSPGRRVPLRFDWRNRKKKSVFFSILIKFLDESENLKKMTQFFFRFFR